MTVKELSQLYWLGKEIETDERRLERLQQQAAGVSSPNYDGMPHGGGSGGMMEKLVAEIVDLQAIIAAKRIQCIHEKQRLERYISGIPDSYTRQIFELRFVECLPWEEVGEAVHLSPDGARKKCYRYLDSTDEEETEGA